MVFQYTSHDITPLLRGLSSILLLVILACHLSNQKAWVVEEYCWVWSYRSIFVRCQCVEGRRDVSYGIRQCIPESLRDSRQVLKSFPQLGIPSSALDT